ncbi:MAG: AbrB/MazE/SpoVT family DNA-binding domain-containing protein [Candidatus Latescibacterota bacterium]
MGRVTISPKYQIVIPQEIGQAMKLYPGQKVQVIMYGNRIELVPEKNIRDMRGFLKGVDTRLQRDGDRI